MPNPMTVKGAESLREELAHRKGALRQEIAEAIAEARAHGDLKENAEYHAAREQHGSNEGRITEVEAKLSSAQVIDVTRSTPTAKWCLAPRWTWPTPTPARSCATRSSVRMRPTSRPA